MQNKPLINPKTKDFPRKKLIVGQKLSKQKNENQLKFDLDNPFTRLRQRFNSYKDLMRRRNDFIEISQQWKNPAFPFAIMSAVFTIITFFIIGVFRFSDIPPSIPIIYDSVENRWDPADKSIIFIFPILLAGIEIIIINNSMKIFETDRRLGIIMAWILTFLNALMLIALAQISSLLL